ncbi:Hypothetical protein Minf_1497 [Methylacidiphilum infernorum V4]|uniref:Uncharacterized protein n=1 Tax=Methylacidiphilum infernorum (isolate V4) TaxID=481448 RepID=B3DW48_METI4|nr:Hypothetical protein Minf_1497 [Methylacidiphilum infernorum V4]
MILGTAAMAIRLVFELTIKASYFVDLDKILSLLKKEKPEKGTKRIAHPFFFFLSKGKQG